MKKLISILLSIAFIFSLFGCTKKEEEKEKQVGEIYQNCFFQNLETFTEHTKIKLTEKEDGDATATYRYVIFEADKADKNITEYKEYLDEYGFVLKSDVSSETMVFEYKEKKLEMKVSSGSSGTEVSITLPYDDKTLNENKEKVYQEVLTAFNNKEYKECMNIVNGKFLDGYKDYDKIIAYANAEEKLRLSDWNGAITAFEKCGNFKDAPARAKELKDQRTALNGTYLFTNDYNQKVYWCIKDGKAGFNINAPHSDTLTYKMGDPISYAYDLYRLYFSEDDMPFVNGEHTPKKTDDGVIMYSAAFGQPSDKLMYSFMAVDDGGMFLMPYWSSNAVEVMMGIYYKVGEPAPAK